MAFRDLLYALVCAQTGVVYRPEDKNASGLLQAGGVELNIADAEHELGLCIAAIGRAKESLAPTPAPKGRRRAKKVAPAVADAGDDIAF